MFHVVVGWAGEVVMKIAAVARFFMVGFSGCLFALPAVLAEDSSSAVRPPAPLFEGLGEYHHPITTRSALAQRYFDQGLTLCYGFNHPEAIRSFRGALQQDPECAMAHWGIAYASGPHVNKPMDKEDNVRAWGALQKAVALKSKASPLEQAFIDAMARRYQAEFKEDRSDLDKAYAAAMREVAKQYPDDQDAQTLLAEALMDTMPWDYWLKDRSPKPETEEAFAALREVLKRNPNHPGATHFYIHAVEAGPNPELGLPSADRLRTLVPQAGHLVHMPSHIYMRVGQYQDAEQVNQLAVKADRSYIQHCAAQGFYPGVYYPHNQHFLWYATLFEGRSAEALAAARQSETIARDNYCGPNKALEGPRFRHLPWLTLARFGRWNEVLQVPQPPATNDFLIDRAMWHFTRGLALAARGEPDAAAREQVELAKLAGSDDAKQLDNPNFPASGVLAVADHWLAGKVAEARNDSAATIESLQKAVAAEDALPYMEPAYWPIPTRPTLGAAMLKAGKAADAEQIFREDLKRWPRNGWGLLGLERSLRAQGKSQSADLVRREFEQAWQRADVKLDLTWF
jgi:tetratricopeptide (TPR) repeat protein